MARVQAVSSKAENLLVSVGRQHKDVHAPMRLTSGGRSQERLTLLSDRLARLEALLDEVASSGALTQSLSYRQPSPPM
eukprot:1440272-Amphidinium_carterae.1